MIKITVYEEPQEYIHRQKLVTWDEAMEFGTKNGLKLLDIDELCSIPYEELMKIPGVLAGFRNAAGSFYTRGLSAYFWSSSVTGSSAWRRLLYYIYETEYRNILDKSYGFSAIYKKEE